MSLWMFFSLHFLINIHDQVAGPQVSVSHEVPLSDHIERKSMRQMEITVNIHSFISLYMPKTVTCTHTHLDYTGPVFDFLKAQARKTGTFFFSVFLKLGEKKTYKYKLQGCMGVA